MKILVEQYNDGFSVSVVAGGKVIDKVRIGDGESLEPLVELFEHIGLEAEFQEVY